jgi:hypothetical protein
MIRATVLPQPPIGGPHSSAIGHLGPGVNTRDAFVAELSTGWQDTHAPVHPGDRPGGFTAPRLAETAFADSRAVTNTPWLKSMEHGALGEARAKAFLMNRFWVLERSVDVHGADFIVQLNSLRVNVLDSKPPRFGVIQVKFVQDGNTNMSVPVRYTQDEAGNPAGEFFLIVCTGRDDDERLFLLSAAEISAMFTRKSDDDRDVYEGRANQILRDSNFEVISQSLGLKRIEAALTRADVRQNKQYLRHLGAGGAPMCFVKS